MGHTTKFDKLDAPGPTFLAAKREGGPMKQENVTLRIPVEPTYEAHRLDIEATIAMGLPPPTELVQVCLSSNVYYYSRAEVGLLSHSMAPRSNSNNVFNNPSNTVPHRYLLLLTRTPPQGLGRTTYRACLTT
jgi:hypothetical protein